jgi:hypothetical protein
MFIKNVYHFNTFHKSIFLIVGLLFSSSGYTVEWHGHDDITVDRLKSIASFVIEKEDVGDFKTSDVLEGDVIFIKTDFLNFFFTKIFPHIPPVVIITHDSYAPSPGAFAKYLNNPKIIHWFGAQGDIYEHPKFTHIPIGITINKWKPEDQVALDKILSVFDLNQHLPQNQVMYMYFSPEINKEHALLLEKFSHKSFVVYDSSSNLQEYLWNMAQCRYVLSQPDNGIDCHQTWEALLVGSIPVVKSSTLDPLYRDLPVITVNSWDDITLERLKLTDQMMKYSMRENREKLTFTYWVNLICSKCSAKRNYISGSGFRKIADFVIDMASQRLPNPADVGPGSIFFVQACFLDFFFLKILPTLLHPIILITHYSDDPAPGNFAAFLDDPKLIRWFGQNCDIKPLHPKFTPIPIGLANPDCKNGKPNIYENLLDQLEHEANAQPRINRLYINFVLSHVARNSLPELFANNKLAEIAKRKPFKEYLKEMSKYRYVLSPRGYGLDCFRTWEALLMGCIPVVETSTLDPLYEDLPVIIVQNWSDINEDYLEKEYDRIKSKPFKQEKLFMDYWADLILACKANAIKSLI